MYKVEYIPLPFSRTNVSPLQTQLVTVIEILPTETSICLKPGRFHRYGYHLKSTEHEWTAER